MTTTWRFLPVALATAGCCSMLTACREGPRAIDDSPLDAQRLIDSPDASTRELVRSGEDASFTLIVDLDVDSKGNIYVADWGARSITVLDPRASYVRMIGRDGTGPGEFRRVTSIHIVAGDTVMVFDRSIRRLTTFAPGGNAFVRMSTLRSGALSFPLEIHRVPGTGFWLGQYSRAFTPEDTREEAMNRRDLFRLLRADGSLETDSLLQLPSEHLIVARRRGSVMAGPNPFGARPLVAITSDDRVIAAWGDSQVVHGFDTRGTLLGTARVTRRRVRVTDQEFEDELQFLNARAQAQLRTERPDAWPLMRALVADDAGRFWVGLSPGRTDMAEWLVFSSDFTYLGSVRLPPRLTLFAIRSGKAYGVLLDATDVPTIVVYDVSRLDPPGTPS